MRKINRLHVAAALLMIVSVVSLLGISLAAGTSTSAVTEVKIKSTTPVEPKVWWETTPGQWFLFWWIAINSPNYNSWGRQRIHILMYAQDLASGEDIDVYVYGRLYNATGTASKTIQAAHYVLSDTYPTYETTLYVPSKTFYFSALGPETSKISLSFYLSGS